MKYRILILLLPLFSFDCYSKRMMASWVEVENQLPVNVYCLPSFKYPDTSLNFTSKSDILANDGIYFIKANDKHQLFTRRSFCDKTYWERELLSDTLQVFVIDEKVLKEKSWGQIYSNDLYLRRILFTYDEIINNGCKIVIK